MAKVAVIDFGTNTFHILIVSDEVSPFKEIYKERIFVNLAESGIHTLGEGSIARANEAVVHFKGILDEHELKELRLYGTEALRFASNGDQVTSFITKILGKAPEIISGDREAELILKGTRSIVNLDTGMKLLMDIGGGSVEFVCMRNGTINYQKSLKLGVTVLYNDFHKNEPITRSEIQEITTCIKNKAAAILPVLNSYSNISLIGASGSFEVLQSMIEKRIKRNEVSCFKLQVFDQLYETIIHANLEQRLQMEGLAKQRAKLIVVAFILMKTILDLADFKEIIVSPFALKEGAISEMFNF